MATLFFKALVLATVSMPAAALLQAQASSFTVTVVPPVHGTLQLVPPLPPDGKYPGGTVVTVKTTPDRGYVLDSAWYSVPGRFGQMYHEGMGREFAVTIDRDKRIGASFIEEAAVSHINVTHDIVYAKPGVKALKYDVYSPKGAKNLPVIVIIHGGGWVANDENIMRGLARELTRGGRFVVFSMDYRWAGKEDGDATSTTMANIIEDVFGGIAHIMEHAKEYGGDPAADDSWKHAIAPLPHIPAAKERAVPQFQVRGTNDRLVLHDDAQEYLDALVKAGQRAEYTQVGGAGHAFFDWKPDETTKATFAKYGVYYAAAMKAFFESVLH